MKKGFLSLELIFSIVILGLVLSFALATLSQSYDNSLEKNPIIYAIEDELIRQNKGFKQKDLSLDASVLKKASFNTKCVQKDGIMLCTLRPLTPAYKAMFK